MLAALILAALPIGVWPIDVGPASLVVGDVEFYTLEPEDAYAILAVQPLATPLTKVKEPDVQQLVSLAKRLGADGVLLLGEVQEKSIPKDLEEPLPTTGRYVLAVFLVFEDLEKEKTGGESIRRSAMAQRDAVFPGRQHGRPERILIDMPTGR